MKVRNNSQITWQSSLRSNTPPSSRQSTSAEGSSKSTPTKKATTPTKRQVSTDVQTPYALSLQIKNKKPRVLSAPLLSKKAQEVVSKMQNKDTTSRRNLIKQITPQKNQYQCLPIARKSSYQSSSINYGTSQGQQSRVNSLSVSLSASNANFNGDVGNPFDTEARLMPVQAKTGVFGNNEVEIAPEPYILTVTPQKVNNVPSQYSGQGDDIATTAQFGDNNLKATTIRRSRSQRLAERSQTSVFTPAINSSSSSKTLNQTTTDVKIEGCIKETCDTKKLSVLQKKYSGNFKINQKLGINSKINQRHNFSPVTPNNTTVTQGQNPDFYRRQRFSRPILKGDNGAPVKQVQSRLANVVKPKQGLSYRDCMFGTDPQNKPVTSYGVYK